MADVLKLRWTPHATSGLSRRDRRGCDYEAYLPDDLHGRRWRLAAETAADVADAERAVLELNAEASALAGSEAMARLLLRAEAVASSRIEGLEVGGRRLMNAQVARTLGAEPSDVTAVEVLNNIEAMRWAVEHVAEAEEITVSDLVEIHGRLLADTPLERYGGALREEQNWIGGSAFNPCSAVFVPPPADRVEALLHDLCAFCNDDSHAAIVQAAIAHAQFETIHPFVDGNGRTGRALIQVILRRRGLARTVVPPISLILATWATDYVRGLTATRYVGDPNSEDAADGLDAWLSLFAAATTRAVADALRYEARVRQIQGDWRERLGRVRRDSAALRLIEALPGAPVVTVQTAAALIDRSEQATNEAVRRLADAAILHPTTIARRNRAFEATDLLDAFTDLERQLASPQGDTRSSEPERRVPARRR